MWQPWRYMQEAMSVSSLPVQLLLAFFQLDRYVCSAYLQSDLTPQKGKQSAELLLQARLIVQINCC
jgi:hypothetical protein